MHQSFAILIGDLFYLVGNAVKVLYETLVGSIEHVEFDRVDFLQAHSGHFFAHGDHARDAVLVQIRLGRGHERTQEEIICYLGNLTQERRHSLSLSLSLSVCLPV